VDDGRAYSAVDLVRASERLRVMVTSYRTVDAATHQPTGETHVLRS